MLRWLVFLSLAGLVFLPPLWRPAPVWEFREVPVPPAGGTEPLWVESALPPSAASVHAAATAVRDGRLVAVWYAGSREGAGDVEIYFSAFDGAQWSPARAIMGRERAQADLGRHIRKVGNAVIAPDAGGLRLFFVTTSIGGWATAAVNVAFSADGGATWGRARRLVTTPLGNISTLVRNPPVRFADGALGVPVYQEFSGIFGELLRVDGARVVDKSRMTWGMGHLQPAVVVLSERRAVAFFRRYGGGRVHRAETGDGGASWSAPEPVELPNPDSAVAALRLSDGRLLLAYNHARTKRNDLSLALSADEGRTWRRVHVVAEGAEGAYSYPCLDRTPDGVLHLLYSRDREEIRHVRFNEAWLFSR